MKKNLERFINHIFYDFVVYKLYDYYYSIARKTLVYYCLNNCYTIKDQLTIIKRCLRHVVCRYTFHNQ